MSPPKFINISEIYIDPPLKFQEIAWTPPKDIEYGVYPPKKAEIEAYPP
jgi:hypothetical protein